MPSFAEAKADFDRTLGAAGVLDTTPVPVHGEYKTHIPLLSKGGGRTEQYYKWQFLHSLIRSGLVPRDYIGAEIWFPKGNPSSAALQLDGAIFDDRGLAFTLSDLLEAQKPAIAAMACRAPSGGYRI